MRTKAEKSAYAKRYFAENKAKIMAKRRTPAGRAKRRAEIQKYIKKYPQKYKESLRKSYFTYHEERKKKMREYYAKKKWSERELEPRQ
jgi:hypothetical protein